MKIKSFLTLLGIVVSMVCTAQTPLTAENLRGTWKILIDLEDVQRDLNNNTQ
jgi:hypothetical protein